MVDDLTWREIEFHSLTEDLDTEGAMGKAMLTIMAAFAQLERDTMIESHVSIRGSRLKR
jgi:DNA invertase Pin-like site-specific DNA recombinase